MQHIGFSIAPVALAALDELGKHSTDTVAVLITIEKEELTLLAPPVSSSAGGFEGDLKEIRRLLDAEGATAAYIVVRSAPHTHYVVIYVSDAATAKNRMLYSTGASRLVEATPQAQKRTIRIDSVSELLPSLFEAESKKARDDLMTESERHRAAIALMEVAPQTLALPGVDIKVTNEADDMLSQFAGGTVDVVTFKIAGGQLQADKALKQLKGGLEQVKSLLADIEPRFVLLRYASAKTQRREAVMVYVCPPTCSPKIKIQYASSAAVFRERASRHEIQFARKVETDSPGTLVEDVHSAFEPCSPGSARGAEEASQSCSSASLAPKGHRMLI
ncbi:hypothetical protein LSCM1_02248 [Leishmania martiniquensis]|uniref:ADF-H domain-containing protein n=1 Tax=Leishmania martiniquensis TaxID=1580590 RepID=A0A836GMG4_9TRYP|nr:hypothetical protein LSCM1_02248 [Leishmania martiniquensis]